MPFRLLVAACLSILPFAVHADPAPRPSAGQKLAQQYCAECHVIVPGSGGGWTDAPSFDAIANRKGMTAQRLSGIIQRPHMHMLNTERPPAEANQIAAYILTLRNH